MALEFATLAEQKQYSQILHGGQDATISALIKAASHQVKNYLGNASAYVGDRDDLGEYDSTGNPETGAIKPEVKIATMMLVDIQLWPDRHRNAYTTQGRLPQAVESLLYPLRDPALQ